MCQSDITKSIGSDIESGVLETSRAFRRKDQEKRAREFSRATLKIVDKWQKALWDIMHKMADDRDSYLPPVITIPKSIYPEDIEAIIALFTVATPEEIAALNALFESFGLQMRDVFERQIPATYQQGLDIAYEEMQRHAGRQDPALFAEVASAYTINTLSPFYQSFAGKGLQLVADKVSVQMKGKVFERLANAIQEGKNWSEMATDLYNNVGTGLRGRKHWERIVRTEMAFAYEQSQRERYADAGIKFVRRSLANSACPRCKALAGVWREEEAPRLIVHPNCRCRYVPFYRLPRGANPRNVSELTGSAAEDAAPR